MVNWKKIVGNCFDFYCLGGGGGRVPNNNKMLFFHLSLEVKNYFKPRLQNGVLVTLQVYFQNFQRERLSIFIFYMEVPPGLAYVIFRFTY